MDELPRIMNDSLRRITGEIIVSKCQCRVGMSLTPYATRNTIATGSASFVGELRRNPHCIGPSTQGENMALTTKRELPRSVLVLVTTCCSLLITACAGLGTAPQRIGPPVGCRGPGADCNVDVIVNNCAVSVDPPTIYVPPANNVIKWTIQATDGTGYHFPQDGITIKNPGGSGITRNPGVIGTGTMFVMADNHQVQGPIPYSVLVVRDGGTACPLLDPIIFNQ